MHMTSETLPDPAPVPGPWRTIFLNGLWKQNTGLVQLLGLCPVLAISTSIINGVSLGLATALVTALSGGAIAAVRDHIPSEIRNPVFILIIAALVTCVDLLINAYLHGLYAVLGIFIPLITTNCIVMARAEAFASRNPVRASMLDGFSMGLGLTLVLAVLGAVRELLGRGTLLSGAELVFGPAGKAMTLHLGSGASPGFLLALLPPGAFFGLGLLVALKQWHEARQRQQTAATIREIAT
ncbi:electron transport complex protein RnfE [Gulbenkiania mobilis]|uniref:Ion-translocating oxidoreductase complex subunit E n=2 Tax=Gulbenkiania mobilis TaxID=397457 RepID=A0ABY2CV23_GULMO|nr:electron transport complex protein RnfE [Gulbenkiania mobilis]